MSGVYTSSKAEFSRVQLGVICRVTWSKADETISFGASAIFAPDQVPAEVPDPDPQEIIMKKYTINLRISAQ